MSTNNVLHQLDHNMPESGENILVTRSIAPNAVGVVGSTVVAAAGGDALSAVQMTTTGNQAIVPFDLTDDVDRDPATARLRLSMIAGIISGTTPTFSLDIAEATEIYTAQADLAAAIVGADPGITPVALSATAGVFSRVEFNLDPLLRALLEQAKGSELRALHLDVQGTLTGTSPIGQIYSFQVIYGSMIVPALVSRRE